MSFPTSVRLLAAAAAGALVLGLSACGGGNAAPPANNGSPGGAPSGEITWSTWGSPEELERYRGLNEEFMKRHPEITVKLQPVAS